MFRAFLAARERSGDPDLSRNRWQLRVLLAESRRILGEGHLSDRGANVQTTG